MLYPAELRARVAGCVAAARPWSQLRRVALVMLVMALVRACGAAGEASSDADWRMHGPFEVVGLSEELHLRLADGRMVRLAGVVVPSSPESSSPESSAGGPPVWRPRAEVVRAVGDWLEVHGAVRLIHADAPYDRAGRVVAQVEAADGDWLQARLVRDGLVWVRPDLQTKDDALRLLPLEREARAAGRGIWRAGGAGVVDAADAEAVEARVGRYGVVRGRVRHAQDARRYVYLNFGADWRTDPTLRLPHDTAKAMRQAGRDPLDLQGSTIEARGWIFEENGPMIEIGDGLEIEVVR